MFNKGGRHIKNGNIIFKDYKLYFVLNHVRYTALQQQDMAVWGGHRGGQGHFYRGTGHPYPPCKTTTVAVVCVY